MKRLVCASLFVVAFIVVAVAGAAVTTRVVVPGLTKCSGGRYDRASDPWVSFALNGDLYAISLSFDFFDLHNAIIVSKSTNGGDTWSAPKEITADDTDGLDKGSITADPHNSTSSTRRGTASSRRGSTHAGDQGIMFVRDYEALTTSGNAFQPFFIQAVSAPSNPTDAYFTSIP